MKTNFEKSLEIVLRHEGGFVNHPKDPGGATNKGVTLTTYNHYYRGATVEDLKAITDEEVSNIYKIDFWDRCKCDDLPNGLDLTIFDFAINVGPSKAIQFLQGMVSARQDGHIGPNTLDKIKTFRPEKLIIDYAARREAYYRSLSTFDTFGRGWLRRTAETEKLSLELI